MTPRTSVEAVVDELARDPLRHVVLLKHLVAYPEHVTAHRVSDRRAQPPWSPSKHPSVPMTGKPIRGRLSPLSSRAIIPSSRPRSWPIFLAASGSCSSCRDTPISLRSNLALRSRGAQPSNHLHRLSHSSATPTFASRRSPATPPLSCSRLRVTTGLGLSSCCGAARPLLACWSAAAMSYRPAPPSRITARFGRWAVLSPRLPTVAEGWHPRRPHGARRALRARAHPAISGRGAQR